MNTIFISGNITAELELKEVNGSKVVNFSIGVKKTYKDENGEYGVDFFRIAAWNQTAEFLSTYKKKGDKVFITGNVKISTQMINDKKYEMIEIVATNVE